MPCCVYLSSVPAHILELSQHQLCLRIYFEKGGVSTSFVLLFIKEQNVRTFCLVDNFFAVTMLLSLVMLHDSVHCQTVRIWNAKCHLDNILP